jgi:energy-coupling factor transport system substrate-specific component
MSSANGPDFLAATPARPGGVASAQHHRSAIPVAPLSAVVLLLASVGGLVMFIWPLLISAEPQPQQHVSDAPFVFMAILPVLVLLVLTQLGDGGMDTKALAMLGVLAAVNAALRPLGAGLNGI